MPLLSSCIYLVTHGRLASLLTNSAQVYYRVDREVMQANRHLLVVTLTRPSPGLRPNRT